MAGSGQTGALSPSPLLPLRNFIRFGRFAGLPLKPGKNSDNDDGDLRLEESGGAYFALLAYTALVVSCFGMLWGVCYFVQGYDPSQFTQELMEQGMTTTEVIAMFCGFTPNLFVLVGYLLIFRVRDTGLQNFMDKFRQSGIFVEKGNVLQSKKYYVLTAAATTTTTKTTAAAAATTTTTATTTMTTTTITMTTTAAATTAVHHVQYINDINSGNNKSMMHTWE